MSFTCRLPSHSKCKLYQLRASLPPIHNRTPHRILHATAACSGSCLSACRSSTKKRARQIAIQWPLKAPLRRHYTHPPILRPPPTQSPKSVTPSIPNALPLPLHRVLTPTPRPPPRASSPVRARASGAYGSHSIRLIRSALAYKPIYHKPTNIHATHNCVGDEGGEGDGGREADGGGRLVRRVGQRHRARRLGLGARLNAHLQDVCRAWEES